MKTVDGKQLIMRAMEAAGRAYAPYSHYHVGAALLAEDGQIFTGCNIEINNIISKYLLAAHCYRKLFQVIIPQMTFFFRHCSAKRFCIGS